MEKKNPSKFAKKKENILLKNPQYLGNSALRKMLQKQNMDILRAYSQKEFSEVFLGFYLIYLRGLFFL